MAAFGRIVAALALSGMFCVSSRAFAAVDDTSDALSCMEKTWKGTIGAHAATFYFDPSALGSTMAGYYYYGTSPHDLVLVQDTSRPGRWKEMDVTNKVTGVLELSCTDTRLIGTWTDPSGKTVLPLRAEPTSEPYAQRRAAATRPIPSGPFQFGRFQYEILRTPHYKEVVGSNEIRTVRLLGEGAGLARINAVLRAGLDEALQTSTACSSSGRISRGVDHDFEHASEQHLVEWNDQFVVIGGSAWGDCGGPHPYADAEVSTYRVSTGGLEAISSWLVPAYASGISPASPLGKRLLERYKKLRGPDEQACVDAVSFSASDAWPSKDGMTFHASVPDALSGCEERVTLAPPVLAPFLSTAGQANLQVFRPSVR
ncbi:hypothetical protein [Ralstonia solanacearum]|uniref:hypothetical protein n=1 Tax=Ralstonia solanacearum TaxID=305 RepID=UPI0018D0BD85|nr:hypothetical protein [Ralstonia solanacearum]